MCFPLMASFLLREGEEAVTVVLVLLATSLDLSGNPRGQVVDEGVKVVKNVGDAALFVKHWKRNSDLLDSSGREALHFSS